MQKATTSKDNAWTFWLCAVCALAGWCWDDAEAQHEPERQWMRVDLSAHLQPDTKNIERVKILPYDEGHWVVLWRVERNLKYPLTGRHHESLFVSQAVLVRRSDGTVVGVPVDIPPFVDAVPLGYQRIFVMVENRLDFDDQRNRSNSFWEDEGWFVLHSGAHDETTIYHDLNSIYYDTPLTLSAGRENGGVFIAAAGGEYWNGENGYLAWYPANTSDVEVESVALPEDHLGHLIAASCHGVTRLLYHRGDSLWFRQTLEKLDNLKWWRKMSPAPQDAENVGLICEGGQLWAQAWVGAKMWIKRIPYTTADAPWEQVQGEVSAKHWPTAGGVVMLSVAWLGYAALTYRSLDLADAQLGAPYVLKNLSPWITVEAAHCDDRQGVEGLGCVVAVKEYGQFKLAAFVWTSPSPVVAAAIPVLKPPPLPVGNLTETCGVDELPQPVRAVFVHAVEQYCAAHTPEPACRWLPTHFSRIEPTQEEKIAKNHVLTFEVGDDEYVNRVDLSPCILNQDKVDARVPFELVTADWFSGLPEDTPVNALPVGISWVSLYFEPVGEQDWRLSRVEHHPVWDDSLHEILAARRASFCERIPPNTSAHHACNLSPETFSRVSWITARFATQIISSDDCDAWDDQTYKMKWFKHDGQWLLQSAQEYGCEDCH